MRRDVDLQMNKELFPLTEPQKNFLQLEQVNCDEHNLYAIYSILKFPKTVDLKILDLTVNKVRELNDSIRIHFIKDDKTNEYMQYIEDYCYEKTDIIKSNSDDILKVVEKVKEIPFSVDGKPNKFYIVVLPSCVYILFASHHILADGYGMTNVANELKDFYYLIENNMPIENYPISSYKNFINREQEYLTSSRFEKDELYWKSQIAQTEPCTIFKNKTDSKKANRFDYPIPFELSEEIEKYCEQNKITEYSFYLAIVSIYYNYIYNLSNLTFGTPFLNRQKRNDEFFDTGLHVCTLPLNINIDINSDFVSLCNNINSANLSLYKHGNYPYNKIQKMFRNETNTNANLYEIGFSYQIGISEKEFVSKNYTKKENDGVGSCAWIFSGSQSNAITFHITQLNTQKIFSIDYIVSVFEDDEIEKINSVLFSLINQVLAGKTDLNNFNILLDEDIKLLNKFNSTGNIEEIDKNIIDYFDDAVKNHPLKTALICNQNELSYEEFNNKINFLTNYLLENKIEKNTPIALLFDKSFEMMISIFAVLKAECHYVPILPDENMDRISYIIKDCNPSCILTHNNYEKIVSKFKITTFNLDNIFGDYSSDKKYEIKNTHLRTIKPDDLAYMIYTSGSTGNPKGVQIMHKNITGFIESLKNNKALKPLFSDVSMSLLKYSFDASGIDIYSSLLIGGSLLIISKKDELNPVKVLELIAKYKVTRSFLIPKWIEHIVQTSLTYNYNLSNLKLLGTGGEVLKPALLKQFSEKYPQIKIANLYGPSETTMFTTYKIVSETEIESNNSSIGSPIPYSRIAIINSNNSFMPINTEGELIVYEDKNSIENLAKGYLNLEEQTSNRFINIFNPLTQETVRAYKTGDYAKINKNLEIEFIGRKDDIVKVNGGYLIALNEVEERINSLLADTESYAVAVPYKNTKAIVLFVKLTEKSFTTNTIKNFLKRNLSFYMQPKKIIDIPEIPRTSSGKIDRQKLREIAAQSFRIQKNSIIKPKTDTEQEIYNAIRDLISIDEFSITDDFIDDLGIDSLALTSLYVALKNHNLNMQDFYTYPNIQDLAYFIDNNKKTNCMKIEKSSIEKCRIVNNSKPMDLSTVLLTGATGFLGIHLLRELLLNKQTKKIYCIIRNKIGIEGYDRLLKLIDYYYNSDAKLLKLISKKVIVLNGDITENYFNLEKDVYQLLQKEVKTVINSAANVKHFEKPEQIIKDNVLSVDNILEFCGENISLAHMSTLSIAGFKEKNTIDSIFNENTLYIKQGFNNNPYLISKFNAEIHILTAIVDKKINAKIFRLGNIMPRQSDGKFQPNFNQNIFISAMRNIYNLKVIPQNLLDLDVEFSPVDECAKSIIILLNSKRKNVFHIVNNNLISIKNLIKIFEESSSPFTLIDYNKFKKELEQNTDKYVREYILENNLNNYSEKCTLNELSKYNFKWLKTDNNYIKNIISIIGKE